MHCRGVWIRRSIAVVVFRLRSRRFCFSTGDVAIWDNRSTQHYAIDDYGTQERIVRLVRSKGVGVYFVTQNPLDIPDSVLAQLGNRVQHALRAFTPRVVQPSTTCCGASRRSPSRRKRFYTR